MVHECAFLDYFMFSKIFKYLKFNVPIFCPFSVRPSLEPGWLEGNLDGRRGLGG